MERDMAKRNGAALRIELSKGLARDFRCIARKMQTSQSSISFSLGVYSYAGDDFLD
jgi:hypothetical protein